MSLRSRGAAGSAARTKRVLARFGATAGAMSAHLDRYEAIAREFGAHPTWPATACVVARHPQLLRRYVEDGAELAVHGLVHGDYAVLDERTQHDTIARALDIFARAGIAVTGFRGPYLRYNSATLEVVRALGLRWHSSQAILFPPRDQRATAARAVATFAQALELYRALDARAVVSLPRMRRGLVDIPVAIPDDEIIVERLALEGAARVDEWRHILEITHRRGELFTLQLHPERIPELGPALADVLAEARRLGTYIARLDEIASWWTRRSGFTLSVTKQSDGRYRAHLEGDDDAALVVRTAHGEIEIAHRDVDLPPQRRPVVAVSRRTPEAVGQFLRDDGLPVEVSDDAAAFGAYIDRGGAWTEVDVLEELEHAPGPLVRIARWPHGARSALAITGDIDAITIKDFVLRSWETRSWHATQGEWT